MMEGGRLSEDLWFYLCSRMVHKQPYLGLKRSHKEEG